MLDIIFWYCQFSVLFREMFEDIKSSLQGCSIWKGFWAGCAQLVHVPKSLIWVHILVFSCIMRMVTKGIPADAT